MDVGKLRLDRLDHVGVEVAGEVGVYTALETHLGRPALPRLAGSLHDLLDTHQIGLAPQVERAGALGEGAEPAAEVAEVCVIDVPVDHIGHPVAVGLLPQQVGNPGDCVHLVATGAEQRLHLRLCRRHAVERSLQDGGEVTGAVQLLGGPALHPEGVAPLRRKAPSRYGERFLEPRRPPVAGPGGPRPVHLAEPDGEERRGKLRPNLIDVSPDGESGSLHQGVGGERHAQRRQLLRPPVAQEQIPSPRANRRHRVLDRVHENRDGGDQTWEPGEIRGIGNAAPPGPEEDRLRPGQRIEHDLARVLRQQPSSGNRVSRHRRAPGQ